jgi:Zn-dependent metalloprotease
MHAGGAQGKAAFAKLSKARAAAPAFAALGARGVKSLDAETAALRYLDQALESDAVAAFARPQSDGVDSEFKSLGAEAVPLTGTTIVKFRQMLNQVPVYGSFVTVELDKDNQCLGINSSMGTPKGVRHIASVAPGAALAVAAKAAGQPAASLNNTPRLHYYFDRKAAQWRLVYIIEDVPQRAPKVSKDGRRDALRKDYVVDGHSGKLIAELPRTPSMAALSEVATDGRRMRRTITVESGKGGKRQLRNAAFNISTCNFNFRDPSARAELLPGPVYGNPPQPWPAEAVGAHANAEVVAHFLREVLKRNNIDGKGGAMVASVNCWDREEGTDVDREWRNAYWNGEQMVYGQVSFPDGTFYSIANMLDIVAHEMFHGVTDRTSRLEYETQSGALNESYSDIFGLIIANHGKPISRWRWELGDGFDGPGTALRDFADPTKHDQPKTMKDYRRSRPPYTWDRNDYGWVHDNSGIHNYAAYRIISARAGSTRIFTTAEVAALFFVALTQQLSRTSQFSDSRRAVLQVARSLFRNAAPKTRDAKIKAVERGFAAAGIA